MKLENNYHSLTNSVFDNVILILKSMLVGVCAGGIAVLYRLVLGKGESFAFSLYDFVSGNLASITILPSMICIPESSVTLSAIISQFTTFSYRISIILSYRYRQDLFSAKVSPVQTVNL